VTAVSLTTPAGTPALHVEADLEVQIERDDRPPVRAQVRGSSSRLTMEVDQPGAFAGAADAPALRDFADGLASLGVTLRVEHRGRHLITIGATRAPWWHRRVTGSRRIRLGSLRGVATTARSRAGRTESILPSSTMLPPATVRPLFPTLTLHARRPVGTTHATEGAGGPRLVLAWDYTLGDERAPTYWLGETTVIGSAEDCDVVLPGLEPRHAVVDHVEGDEYVVTETAGATRVHGAGALGAMLRTGARLDLGPHTLVFYREEYADHGRPYGGRIGGELGHQITQPPREQLQAPDDSS
jgi:hypothetical protein